MSLVQGRLVLRGDGMTYRKVFIIAQVHSTYCAEMMRYDTCCPASEEDAFLMINAMRPGNKAEWVIFKRFVRQDTIKEPSVGRWKSFNMCCLPKAYNGYEAAEAARDELLKSRSGRG